MKRFGAAVSGLALLIFALILFALFAQALYQQCWVLPRLANEIGSNYKMPLSFFDVLERIVLCALLSLISYVGVRLLGFAANGKHRKS